jgi:adenylate cyclase
LAETLLARGGEDDVQEAEIAVNRLAAATANKGFTAYDLMLLRLRTLLARARGDEGAYRELLGRYRGMATSLGFERHMAWAEAMT